MPKKPSRKAPEPQRRRSIHNPDRKKRIPTPGKKGPNPSVPPDNNPRKNQD